MSSQHSELMTEEELFIELIGLLATAYAQLPQPCENVKQLAKTQIVISPPPTTIQEALDALKLALQYMVFDLEATRRENSYLRMQLLRRELGE